MGNALDNHLVVGYDWSVSILQSGDCVNVTTRIIQVCNLHSKN